MKTRDLLDHFTKNLNPRFRNWIGAEIETHFLDGKGRPITVECSQKIFGELAQKGWNVAATKGKLVSELRKGDAKILYELGRQNIELSTEAMRRGDLERSTMPLLKELYACAALCDARPFFQPIINSEEDLLIIPDERDASWLTLDGKEALSLLARTASVQFTIETRGPEHAIRLLGELPGAMLGIGYRYPYLQDGLWEKYIETSKAGYRPDRYGYAGSRARDPIYQIENYVDLLSQHDAVMKGKLVSFADADMPIDTFLRSVWWKFRLRRYSDRLCIEIRTIPRGTDWDICAILGSLPSVD